LIRLSHEDDWRDFVFVSTLEVPVLQQEKRQFSKPYKPIWKDWDNRTLCINKDVPLDVPYGWGIHEIIVDSKSNH
jgi:hypothetical protein